MRRLVAAAILFLPTLAAADLTLVNEQVDSAGKTRTVSLSIKGRKTFFEVKENDGTTRTILRDGEAKKQFIIDHQAKSMMMLAEKDSSEQKRAQIAAQHVKRAAVIVYEKKKSPARKVSGFVCEDYLIKRGGKLLGEGCFASWNITGLTEDDFKAVLRKAMPPGGGMMSQAYDPNSGPPGFAVWQVDIDDAGQVTLETTIRSLSTTAMAPANFELPKDYVEE